MQVFSLSIFYYVPNLKKKFGLRFSSFCFIGPEDGNSGYMMISCLLQGDGKLSLGVGGRDRTAGHRRICANWSIGIIVGVIVYM